MLLHVACAAMLDCMHDLHGKKLTTCYRITRIQKISVAFLAKCCDWNASVFLAVVLLFLIAYV